MLGAVIQFTKSTYVPSPAVFWWILGLLGVGNEGWVYDWLLPDNSIQDLQGFCTPKVKVQLCLVRYVFVAMHLVSFQSFIDWCKESSDPFRSHPSHHTVGEWNYLPEAAIVWITEKYVLWAQVWFEAVKNHKQGDSHCDNKQVSLNVFALQENKCHLRYWACSYNIHGFKYL